LTACFATGLSNDAFSVISHSFHSIFGDVTTTCTSSSALCPSVVGLNKITRVESFITVT